MFTVKLVRQNTMKLVEAETIEIFPAGKPHDADAVERTNIANALAVPESRVVRLGDSAPLPCTNHVRGISVTLFSKITVYHVGTDPSQTMGDADLYDCAYIENSEGATTECVYAN